MAAQTPSPRAIGATVRAYRQSKALTIESLADAAGVNVTYLSDIERGRSNPTIAKLGSIAAVFEMRLSALLAVAEEDVQ